MTTYPQYEQTVWSGWRTTVTLTTRSRCGDKITGSGRRTDPGEALAAALSELAIADTLSTIRCRRPGRHGHHG